MKARPLCESHFALMLVQEVLEFCHGEGIILLADEVYQENVYDKNKPFHSFKKVLRSMPPTIADSLELFSFHSVSKGTKGECGRRGGYMECANIDPAIKQELYKMASISLCPNVDGQIAVDLMARPPAKGEPSYDQCVPNFGWMLQRVSLSGSGTCTSKKPSSSR